MPDQQVQPAPWTVQCVPAAIRPLGVTGKVPVIYGKDGRHPKYENHGRIAGR